MANKHRKCQNIEIEPKKEKSKRRLFADCGRPFNVNEPKLEFHFNDSRDRYTLDLHVHKYLDTSLIDVDIEPKYIRVTVKQKVFQLALNEEVRISDTTVQRSQTTGHLLIVMPKLSVDAINPGALNADNFVTTSKPANKVADNHINGGITSVDYKHIVSNPSHVPDDVDESEIPPLC